jgi:hypothetical protein
MGSMERLTHYSRSQIRSDHMRVLALTAFAFVVAMSAGVSAQEQGGAASAREVQKAACQRDAQLIYRTGNSMAADVRAKMIEARRAYVQQCLEKNRPTTG